MPFDCSSCCSLLFYYFSHDNDNTNHSVNKQSADQTVCNRRLLCIFVVCINKQKVANIKYSVNNKSSADLRLSLFFFTIIKANSKCSRDN